MLPMAVARSSSGRVTKSQAEGTVVSTHYEVMKGDTKYRKWGGLGSLE